MTAGVPGTGIGGLFYLVAALLLPARGLIRRVRGARLSWLEIARTTGLALGVFLGIWATGWLLGLILGPAVRTVGAAAGAKTAVLARTENIVRGAALLAGFATLAAVLLFVQAARFLTRKKSQ